MKPYFRYSLLFLIFFVGEILAIAAFNFVVDPYGVTNAPVIERFNKVKPEQNKQVRLFKAIDVARLKPKTIFLGSSRTEFGLDPSHPVLQASQPAYNLALPGANMYEIRRYLEHALSVQPDLELVVLGIDMLMFNSMDEVKPNFRESRLERSRMTLPDMLNVAFSPDAFFGSLRTIAANQSHPDEVGFFYPDGRRDPHYFRKYIYKSDSNLFIFRTVLELQNFMEKPNIDRDYKISEVYLEEFKKIIEICRDNDIELKIFISPAHATYWEALRVVNLWSLWEDWKRQIVGVTPVWDFSGYNSITTEPLDDNMQNYLDNSHYMKDIGDLILNRVFDNREKTVPDDFGVLVSEQNIESQIEKIQRDRDRWAKNNPETVQFVQNIQPGS
jgi:hypothetical protein